MKRVLEEFGTQSELQLNEVIVRIQFLDDS